MIPTPNPTAYADRRRKDELHQRFAERKFPVTAAATAAR